MASKTQNPVMDNVPVKRGPGRPVGPSETTPRSKALKAAKDAVKNLGPAGPTADVAISKQEMAILSGWQLIMGDITWNEPSYQVTVNGEHVGTFS